MSISYPLNTSQLGINAVRRLSDDITYGTNNYYVGFGSPVPSGMTYTPNPPNENNVEYNISRNGMCYFKRITAPNIVSATRRVDWAQGVVYDIYDDAISTSNPSYSGATVLSQANFYVITSAYNVYKCIYNNNNAPSTVTPTGTSTSYIYSADGYVWVYMYTVAQYLVDAFLDSAYIPVTNSVYAQYYSGGSISSATISNPGSGYSANTTLTVSGNGYNKKNPVIVSTIVIGSAGSGYTSTPTITIAPSTITYESTITATATGAINSVGQLTSVGLTNVGYGYANTPTAVVSTPVNGYVSWQSSTNYVVGQIVVYGLYYYNITVGGISSTTPPTGAQNQTNGQCTLQYIATQATVAILGVTNPASISPVISNGQIVGIVVNDGGISYSDATISVSDTTGTGAVLSPNLSIGDLTTNQSTVQLSATKGALSAIVVQAGGIGYTAATVQIIGDGTGATATANLVNGVVQSITITNYGSGYTTAVASIIGNGTGANIRAILAPYNGHGYDAISELYATTAMIQISLGSVDVGGYIPTNQYTQVGIFRNILTNGSNQYYTKQTASGFVLVTATIDITTFTNGSYITQESTGLRFLIVASSATGLLLKHETYGNPVVGDLFKTAQGSSAYITSVIYEDVNLFSGDILQIINLVPFSTTPTQIISFNDIFTF
jgi:hypothetical protein